MDPNDLIYAKGRTLGQAAKLIGCGVSTLGNYLNGKTEAGDELLKKIAAFLKIDPDELPRKIEQAHRIEEKPIPYVRAIPLVSFARAGAADFNYEDLAGQFDQAAFTVSKDRNAFALFVEGDSMEPKVEHGDVIIVEPNGEARNGDMVIARLEKSGGVMIKIYHQIGNFGERVRLTSYNSAVYGPLEFERKEFRFIYPVLEITRRIRRH